jgi:hypothetical protein
MFISDPDSGFFSIPDTRSIDQKESTGFRIRNTVCCIEFHIFQCLPRLLDRLSHKCTSASIYYSQLCTLQTRPQHSKFVQVVSKSYRSGRQSHAKSTKAAASRIQIELAPGCQRQGPSLPPLAACRMQMELGWPPVACIKYQGGSQSSNTN